MGNSGKGTMKRIGYRRNSPREIASDLVKIREVAGV